MLNLVKLSLRIADATFDTEIQGYIDACIAEMTAMGVTNISTESSGTTTYDVQAKTAIIAYCKWHFGQNEKAAEWERIYYDELAKLKTMTGHTEWQVQNG